MTKFAYSTDKGVHIVEAIDGTPEMIMLVRTSRMMFTDFIEAQAKARSLQVVVNGSFVNLTFAAKVRSFVGTDALDPEAEPIGKVIQNEKELAGTASPEKFYFSQGTCNGPADFSAGMGDPGGSSCSAIGGLAPIVVDGLPYGTRNLYAAGVPAGAPPTGDVSAKYKPFLTQKSNRMFVDILGGGAIAGKTAIGYSRKLARFVIAVQQNGVTGQDAEGIRTVFTDRKVENAVFLDCSTSSTLYLRGKFYAKPSPDKNEFLTVAVGFR